MAYGFRFRVLSLMLLIVAGCSRVELAPTEGDDAAPDATVEVPDAASSVDAAPDDASSVPEDAANADDVAAPHDAAQCDAGAAAACDADTDCHCGTVCQKCNHRCVYPPHHACDPNAPCPCGYACIAQVCTLTETDAPSNCVYDTDCPVDEFCNRAVYQCQFPMSVGPESSGACSRNADCPAGYVCSTASAGPTCLYNHTDTCRTPTDCPPTGPFECFNYQCTRPGC